MLLLLVLIVLLLLLLMSQLLKLLLDLLLPLLLLLQHLEHQGLEVGLLWPNRRWQRLRRWLGHYRLLLLQLLRLLRQLLLLLLQQWLGSRRLQSLLLLNCRRRKGRQWLLVGSRLRLRLRRCGRSSGVGIGFSNFETGREG